MSRTPSLAEVLVEAQRSAMRGMFVSLPGAVESYDAATQLASVQPLILDTYVDESGERLEQRYPVIDSVPVVFPGAGSYSITWPVSRGDTGLLVFASSSLDRWIALGGEQDPQDDRRGALTDAVLILGLRAKPQALPSSAVDSSAVVIAAPSIKLGSADASDPPAIRDDLVALKSAINAAAVVAGDGGSAFKTNLLAALASWPSPAGKVRIE